MNQEKLANFKIVCSIVRVVINNGKGIFNKIVDMGVVQNKEEREVYNEIVHGGLWKQKKREMDSTT